MHIRGDNDIRTSLFQPFPRAGQHFGKHRQLGIRFGRQLLNQRKEVLGRYQGFGHDGQMRFPAARKRFGIGGELIGRFQQHAPAFQQHPPNVGEFCPMT